MDDITSKERVFRAINCEDVDKIPVIPQLTYAAAKYKDVSISEALVDPQLQLDALLYAQEQCGYDGIYANWESSSVLLGSAMGCSIITFEDISPRVNKPLVNTPESAKNLCIPHPKKAGRLPLNLELTKNLNESVGSKLAIFNYVPGPFSFAAVLMGVDEALTKIFNDPELLKNVMESARLAAVTFGVTKIQIGAEILTIAEPFANFDNLSPKQFEEICLPSIKKMISELRLKKTKIGLHVCGNSFPLIDLLVETGVDFLELDSKVDLAAVRENIKSDFCLIGNIDTTSLFMKPAIEIENECKDLINKMGDKGFILSSSCEIRFRTPLENICSMVKSTMK
ncbi:MAG: uroporphyrinogen decarboxylase family protein [Candidatus Hodarchaeota archaeon]